MPSPVESVLGSRPRMIAFDRTMQVAAGPRQLIPIPVAPPTPLPPLPAPPIPGAPPDTQPLAPPLRNVLEGQLGLKLESVRMPIEILIIERVERPSEN